MSKAWKQIVTVTKLVKEADLRRVHVYRDRYSPKLKEGEVVLLLNWACDKARLIDSAGGVHNYYAPSGEAFDLDEIQKHIGALHLKLSLHSTDKAYLDWRPQAA